MEILDWAREQEGPANVTYKQIMKLETIFLGYLYTTKPQIINALIVKFYLAPCTTTRA